jgi:hypothetical protein
MTQKQISEKIHSINKKINGGFLTMDEKTHGFYKGQLAVYEIWLGSLINK